MEVLAKGWLRIRMDTDCFVGRVTRNCVALVIKHQSCQRKDCFTQGTEFFDTGFEFSLREDSFQPPLAACHRQRDAMRPGRPLRERGGSGSPIIGSAIGAQALICFLESGDYEDAIRKAVALGGDSDTLACITDGIAEAFHGYILAEMAYAAYERIPDSFRNLISDFEKASAYVCRIVLVD